MRDDTDQNYNMTKIIFFAFASSNLTKLVEGMDEDVHILQTWFVTVCWCCAQCCPGSCSLLSISIHAPTMPSRAVALQWIKKKQKQQYKLPVDFISLFERKMIKHPYFSQKCVTNLQRYVLSIVITLWHISSRNRISLWTGGLYTVSVVLTLSFRTLWFI